MHSCYLLLVLASLALSHPAPRQPRTATASQLACYNTCVSETMCIASFPDGCYCQNNVRTNCSSRCALTERPELMSCEVTPESEIVARDMAVEAPEVAAEPILLNTGFEVAAAAERESFARCFSECTESWFCAAQWPESCHCKNNVKVQCMESCSGFGGLRLVLDSCEE
ncbi:hypothetical protein BJ508DRAFT_73988 [Ascobolus immersus RN42]|uniref:Extracellular membrane protein CFEM domain-containing protein n=1 Tax=Ascobolus immersus RN42 TaxID=1160509 RepID=A0A3N4HI43_ASCIM|nr:hypothetical protein BJ508DRAFT_73988 [Ascobolus immersus RN42]